MLARLTCRDDGENIPEDERVWCLMTPYSCGEQTFCGGEYFGFGEGGAMAETKTVRRGGITCQTCLDHIREIKAVRL